MDLEIAAEDADVAFQQFSVSVDSVYDIGDLGVGFARGHKGTSSPGVLSRDATRILFKFCEKKDPRRMKDGQLYLTTGPKRLRQSCDILLELDDGTELPAHSQVLAKYSEIFSDMLAVEEGGPLFSASASSKIKLPLDDCTEEVAIKFLSVLYSIKPSKYIDEATGFSVARLGHKYGMQVCLRTCKQSQLAALWVIHLNSYTRFPFYWQRV